MNKPWEYLVKEAGPKDYIFCLYETLGARDLAQGHRAWLASVRSCVPFPVPRQKKVSEMFSSLVNPWKRVLVAASARGNGSVPSDSQWAQSCFLKQRKVLNLQRWSHSPENTLIFTQRCILQSEFSVNSKASRALKPLGVCLLVHSGAPQIRAGGERDKPRELSHRWRAQPCALRPGFHRFREGHSHGRSAFAFLFYCNN